MKTLTTALILMMTIVVASADVAGQTPSASLRAANDKAARQYQIYLTANRQAGYSSNGLTGKWNSVYYRFIVKKGNLRNQGITIFRRDLAASRSTYDDAIFKARLAVDKLKTKRYWQQRVLKPSHRYLIKSTDNTIRAIEKQIFGLQQRWSGISRSWEAKIRRAQLL
ncbi:MAG: hypothetical protein CMJ83_20295 [Planctomycetes bacterium]|nr:hypothetical protein [Planctomycetota bacterium]